MRTSDAGEGPSMEGMDETLRVFAWVQSAVDDYYRLVGKLMGESAFVGQHFDGIIALDRGLPSGEFLALPEEIVSLPFTKKLDEARSIATALLGPDHESVLGLGVPGSTVADLRNKVAHSYLMTADPSARTATVQHSPRKAGYVEEVFPLTDLEDGLELCIDLLIDCLVVYSHMPGSGMTPCTRADYPD